MKVAQRLQVIPTAGRRRQLVQAGLVLGTGMLQPHHVMAAAKQPDTALQIGWALLAPHPCGKSSQALLGSMVPR